MQDNAHSSFKDSFAGFTSADVGGDASGDKKELLPSLLLRCLLIALCLAVFSYSLYMLVSGYIETRDTNDKYDSIRADVNTSAVKRSSPLLEPASMFTLREMLDSGGNYKNYIGDVDSVEDRDRQSKYYYNFLSMRSRYPSTYAWIYVSHTRIDYPVMKGDDNDYYLNHDFQGNYTDSGSVFADFRLSDNYPENYNSVFYGHCMKNGTMFRTLKTFMESANRNTEAKTLTIEVYREEGIYIYKLLSAYRNNQAFFINVDFAGSEDYLAFLQKITSLNTFSVTNPYSADSRICTLVTCANVSSDRSERYVMHGVLTAFIPNTDI